MLAAMWINHVSCGAVHEEGKGNVTWKKRALLHTRGGRRIMLDTCVMQQARGYFGYLKIFGAG